MTVGEHHHDGLGVLVHLIFVLSKLVAPPGILGSDKIVLASASTDKCQGLL